MFNKHLHLLNIYSRVGTLGNIYCDRYDHTWDLSETDLAMLKFSQAEVYGGAGNLKALEHGYQWPFMLWLRRDTTSTKMDIWDPGQWVTYLVVG